MKKWITFGLILVGAAAVVMLNLALFSGQLIGLPDNVKTALKSDAAVVVTEDHKNGFISFQPADIDAISTGVIIYPEGHMDPRTYAPIGRQMAEAGYLVVFPSRRTQTDFDRTEELARIQSVLDSYPAVSSWVLGAHTWGANIVASCADQFSDSLVAMVFWAPRFNPGLSLADSSLPTLAIWGTLDEENTGFLAETRPALPPQTEWVVIEGGNRVSFASFGPMAADVGASIGEAAQQSQAAQITLDFLSSLGQ